MDKKSEKLVHRIEKAGIRASVREGHVLTETELLGLKIQILPIQVRIALGLSAVLAGLGSYGCFLFDQTIWAVGLACLAMLLLFFAIFGVRKTLSTILDAFDAASSAEVLGAAADGVVSAMGSLFDGV